jgi:hypothetical protein
MDRKRKLVLIEWVDSHSGRGWQPIREIEQSAGPVYCRSVGWLVSESGNCKVIVPHVSGEKNGNVVPYGCGDLTIPNKAIVRMKVLRA